MRQRACSLSIVLVIMMPLLSEAPRVEGENITPKIFFEVSTLRLINHVSLPIDKFHYRLSSTQTRSDRKDSKFKLVPPCVDNARHLTGIAGTDSIVTCFDTIGITC